MNISVLTPDRQIFIGQISSATLPGVEGEFQVLDNHAALVSSLDGGKVKLVTSGEYRYFDESTNTTTDAQSERRTLTFEIERGFVEVLNNEINLLVQGVEKFR
ncbi:MAG: hypothetical protein AAFQ37_00195 [Bacteroidota bacterium]